MERNEHDLFDQLVREKLTGYNEPPEPEWIKNIHAKKSRVINLYHLYRLMLITALVGAGIFASVQFVPYASNIQSTTEQRNENTFSSQGESTQPASSVKENVPVYGTQYSANAKVNGLEAPITNPAATEKTIRGNRSAGNIQYRANPSLTTDKPSSSSTQEEEYPVLIETPEGTPEVDQNPVKKEDADAKEKNEELSDNCNASFEYFTSYTGEISFTNTSTIDSKNNISWSFGDGVSSYDKEPTHTYQTSGKYEVTLHVKDQKSGCEDELTKTIAYKNPNDKYTPITISGELYAGIAPVKNGWIEVYQFDLRKGGFVLTNTLKTSQSGAYSVSINRNERYILKGLPSSDFSDYTSTFWGNSDNLENASEIVVMPSEKDNLLGYNIELVLGEKQKDPDELKVEPLASSGDQSVLLLDKNNNIVGVGKVDANGEYFFSGSIPPGEYTLLNPSTGISSAKTVSGNNSVSGNIYDKNNHAAGKAVDEKVSVFPNPAGNTVNFGINSSNEETATIILTDAAGVELSRKQITFISGFNQTQYDLSNYSPGIYYVLVFKGNQQVLSNRLVKMADTGKQ